MRSRSAILSELGPAVRELARVLTPGGRLVVSSPYPFATAILGWRAVFVDADAARFVVRRCIEPRLSAEQAKTRAKKHQVEAFEDALTGVPAVIVWEVERQ